MLILFCIKIILKGFGLEYYVYCDFYGTSGIFGANRPVVTVGAGPPRGLSLITPFLTILKPG